MPRVRKYQDGGDVDDLLKMLNAHGAPPPMTEERYYNPEIKDVSSGDWRQDLLYKNPWLMDTPIVGDVLKNLAKKVARQSAWPSRSISKLDLSPFAEPLHGYNTASGFGYSDPLNVQSESRDTSRDYAGDWDGKGDTPIELLDTYFKDEDERDLPKSIYKPKDDYYEWLPSYSLKSNLDPSFYELDGGKKNISNYGMATNFDDFTSIVDDILEKENKSWGDFIKDKKTIYAGSKDFEVDKASRLLNANLGSHKQGLAWDDELQLPYMSISDAWDFEPTDYAKRWAGKGSEWESENRDRAYVQASLMHKAGNPFKIYDRFYIDPETRDYITDEEIKKRRQELNKNKRGGRIPFKVNKGGRVRRHQDGGDVDDLLKMLGKYKGAPEDKELLSSLVSESTQPSGYTQPVLPVDNKIKLIPKPAQITQAPDEVEKADWSTILANPLQAWEYIGKHGLTTRNAEGKLEFTRPTKAELDTQGSNIYDSVMSMFNPSAYVEALKHMGTSVDAADQALLQGFKDGRLSPGDLSNVVGNLSDAGMQALFLSMAPMGGRTWASAIKELRRPALGARIPQEFRGSRLLGPTAETATTESSALQQLASKTPISNPQTNQPIVFYHGTSKSAGDKILAEGFTGQTSLMNRRDYAQNYATSGPRTSGDKVGTVIESHVTLNNPMNFQQNIDLREKIIGEIVGKSPEQLASPGYGMTTAEWQKYDAIINKEFIKRAKELGYDGVYDVNQPEIFVFDPSSIKVVGSSSRGGDPLQQLALSKGQTPPQTAKGKEKVAEFMGTLLQKDPSILAKKLFEAGRYSTLEEAITAVNEIRKPSMMTVLPTSGKTPAQIMQESEGMIIDYYTNSLARQRLTELYGNVKGAGEGISPFNAIQLSGRGRLLANQEDALRYAELYGQSGEQILDELYTQIGMLPRYRVGQQVKIKDNPGITEFASKGPGYFGVYDTSVEEALRRKAISVIKNANPSASDDRLNELADLFPVSVKGAAAVRFTDEFGKSTYGLAEDGLSMIGARELFDMSQQLSNKTGLSKSGAKELLNSWFYHELNHVLFGSAELPIEITNGWHDYMTNEAIKVMYDPRPQGSLNLQGNKKDRLTYHSMPVEIQARVGQVREELMKIGYTKDQIENLAFLASKNQYLGPQYGMSLFDEEIGVGYGGSMFKEFKSDYELVVQGYFGKDSDLKTLIDDIYNSAEKIDPEWLKNTIGGKNKESKSQSLIALLWKVPLLPFAFYMTDPSSKEAVANPEEGKKQYSKGGALSGLVKKYGAGGSVNGWGAQGNFTTEYISKQPDVEELEDPNLIPELNALAAQQESGGEPLTPEEEKRLKGKKALQGAGKGAMAGASFGPWGAVIGGVVGGAIGYFAKKGTKIKKSLYDNGGLFKALRERRTDRRIAKTPVRDASSQEVLEMLSSYGADSPMMQGEYDPREKEIVMYKDDLDTLKHEQVHAAQYGPLQRLAYRMNQDRSAPIQDPTKRKVYRKLSENISPEAYAAFNRAGKMILDKGEEFEAVLDTGVNAAKEKGVNFNVPFEEILSQLKNVPSPTNNMIGLMKFMENRFTREQRDLILKSIR